MNRKKLMLDVAMKEYGVQEIKGGQHNPRIVEYFKTVGHEWVDNDELAWCAAFVGFCLEKIGIRSTKKLNARSYLGFGTRTYKPVIGDVAVFSRGNSPVYGHVAFYVGETDGFYLVLGGNQSNQVQISAYAKSRLLEFRSY